MRTKFLKYNIDNLTFDETIDKIKKLIDSDTTSQHVVLNAGKIILMEKNKKLAEIVNSCELINVDGISIVWMSKFLNNKIKERITGIDLFAKLLSVADEEKYRIYLLGAEEDIIEDVVEKINRKYKGITIAGYRNGFFKEEDEKGIIDKINKSSSQILFVGISSPLKEYILSKYKKILRVPFCMGVGGSFDVLAGKYSRAPKWMQKSGLEWFFRLIQEPKRLWKRYSIDNAKFIFISLKFMFFNNFKKPKLLR